MSGKKSSIIYHDLLSVVDEMPDEMAGKFVKNLLALMQNKEIPTPEFSLKIALHPFISQFKRDNDKYESICERNRTNGQKGGRPRNPKNPSGLSETQNNPNNHDTDTDTGNDTDNDNEKKKEDSGLPAPSSGKPVELPCPHQKIIDLYHEKLPTLRKVKAWSGARENMLRARWRENPERQDLGWWDKYFGKVSCSKFLTGKTDKPFYADLEWLVRPNNLPKVMEGKYSNAPGEEEDNFDWGDWKK